MTNLYESSLVESGYLLFWCVILLCKWCAYGYYDSFNYFGLSHSMFPYNSQCHIITLLLHIVNLKFPIILTTMLKHYVVILYYLNCSFVDVTSSFVSPPCNTSVHFYIPRVAISTITVSHYTIFSVISLCWMNSWYIWILLLYHHTMTQFVSWQYVSPGSCSS